MEAWIGGVKFEGNLNDFTEYAKDAPEVFKLLKEIEQAAIAVGVLSKGPSTGDPKATPSEGPPAKGTPRCEHGAMKDLGDKGYKHRYYCPSADRKNQCEAKD